MDRLNWFFKHKIEALKHIAFFVFLALMWSLPGSYIRLKYFWAKRSGKSLIIDGLAPMTPGRRRRMKDVHYQ